MKGKKVLVTGAAGFIPSHLTRRLVKEGAEIYIITKYNSIFDNIRLADVWDKIHVIEADIRNVDSLKQIKEIAPQIIFHMAAYNHVGDSFMHVSEALDCNGKGTANVIEAYQDFEKFIYMSTSEVYGYQEKVPFTETMKPFPTSPYAVGKYAGELYCQMKYHVKKLPIVITRCFNTFGPYQSERAVIGEIIMNCLTGKPIRATEGKQTRDFNYVENIVDGLIAAATNAKAVGQIMNIGSGEEISIKELIMKIHKWTESKSKLEIGALPYRPTEIWRMCADNTKAKQMLNWKPRISFEEGLKKTIRWYKQYLEAFKKKNAPIQLLGSFDETE